MQNLPVTILLLVSFLSSAFSMCARQQACDDCASYAACYWCESSGKCEEYYGERFADLLCPNKWVQHQSLCPSNSNSNNNMNRLLSILQNMKNIQQQKSQKPQQQQQQQIPSSLASKSNQEATIDNQSSSSSQDLKELLHKLLLLKLLKKIKTEGTKTLTDEEILRELTNSRIGIESSTLTTTTTTTLNSQTDKDKLNNELKQLLSLLNEKTNSKKPAVNKKTQPSNPQNTTQGTTLTKSNLKTKNSSQKGHKPSLLNSTASLKGTKTTDENILKLLEKMGKNEHKAGVVYEEHKSESISKPSTVKANNTSLKQPKKPTTNISSSKNKQNTITSTASSKSDNQGVNFCQIYLELGVCNTDSNCTWCNTRDLCIRRVGSEYNSCVGAKDQMLDKEFGLDKCLAHRNCKSCVENNKCYWCDVSKSCHTYPFFGYVPDSCGGDWYVKQCDVQLAVIIIVLPLIIILLAMVTFYFCLKYCYYRRKVLRVPLFEKPGVFDYRKDKKVYYVNPEDESSDTEMATEKIRKKYRLPVEREPLIDPNS